MIYVAAALGAGSDWPTAFWDAAAASKVLKPSERRLLEAASGELLSQFVGSFHSIDFLCALRGGRGRP